MATPTSDREFEHDVVVICGCGHVGLPFAELRTAKPVADIWNVLGGGVLV